jgi:hypothetical protein
MQASTPPLTHTNLHRLFITNPFTRFNQTIINEELTQALIVHSNVIQYIKC